MAKTPMGNDVVERGLRHWKKHGAIMPAILKMNYDLLQEFIDGVPSKHTTFIRALKYQLHRLE